MSNPAITLVPLRRYYDTATIAETHRRLQADGHNISENMLRGLVRQGVLPAVKLGRKALLYYPNVIKLLTEGNTALIQKSEFEILRIGGKTVCHFDL